jgi:sugar/nucleoside kinase (ribokinase family)
VAGNAAALGAGRVAVLGAIGRDGHGFELKQALQARGIATDLLVEADGILTFTYTKLLNAETGAEDLPRVDFINTRPPPETAGGRVCEAFAAAAGGFDVVIIADQAETAEGGIVTGRLRELAAGLAASGRGKVVWADSRRRAELFRGVIVKPNREEAESACRRAFGDVDLRRLFRLVGGPALVVTDGPRGALVLEARGETRVPARAVAEPVDICGAGDSFSAAAAMALAVTGSAVEAARLGNLAAGVTILKRGTGTASPEEILRAEREGAR